MAGDMAANVGARIRQGRKAKGWTQRQLASALGIAPPPDTQRISEWERGQHMPGEATLARIASAVGRPVSWFYEVKGEPPDLVSAFDADGERLARIEAKLDQALAALERLDPPGNDKSPPAKPRGSKRKTPSVKAAKRGGAWQPPR